MKKLLLTALLLAPQMQAMQMGVASKKVHNKNTGSSCCGTAAKALCLGALLASGQVHADVAGRTSDFRARCSDCLGATAAGNGMGYVPVAGFTGGNQMMGSLGTVFTVAGLGSGGALVYTDVAPSILVSCASDITVEQVMHWRTMPPHSECEEEACDKGKFAKEKQD